MARLELLSRLSCAALVIVVAAAAAAQDTQLTVSTTPGLQQRGVSFGAPALRLSLKDAVALALEHNINLEVSRLGLARLGEGVLAATGIFDPYLSADGSTGYSSTPSSNRLTGAAVAESRSRELNLSLSTLLPTGTQAALSWENTRVETNSTFYFLNPSYESTLGLRLTQPLLKGFGTDVNRNGIEVARKNSQLSRLEFELIVIGTLQQVESAYWDLVYARENLQVKQQSLKLAQDLLEQTRTRVRIGTSAPIDIVQSEATVASREQEIIIAEHAVLEAADVLKGLMGFETVSDWASQVIPTDDLSVNPSTPDLDGALVTALERRTELKQEEIRRQIDEANLVVAENLVRPQLDLVVGYGLTGANIEGYVQDPVTGEMIPVRGGIADAVDMLGNAEYDRWSAAVNLRYPLGNNEAKAQRAQARYQLRAAEQQLAAQRQTVIQQVRRAVRSLDSSAKSIYAAGKARELAERNLDAEQKKFANGMSTNFQVLEIQEDLAAAQAADLQSRVAYRKSMIGYNVSTGTLLHVMQIGLQLPPERKEPHTLWKDIEWMKFSRWADVDEGDDDEDEDAGGEDEKPASEEPGR